MTLREIIDDIHALSEDLEAYERRYGVLSETFYALYTAGTEPDDEAWVPDWSDWAGAYKILLRRQEQYRSAIHALQEQRQSLSTIFTKAARHQEQPHSCSAHQLRSSEPPGACPGD